ncbi:hypothetical protein GY45DRAFT_676902 [Cubamyces sp. BRFM 1775]|nr:hypothetical protein GY45DRAFT_676902 [Cubamyces sp. BRFM 1775]
MSRSSLSIGIGDLVLCVIGRCEPHRSFCDYGRRPPSRSTSLQPSCPMRPSLITYAVSSHRFPRITTATFIYCVSLAEVVAAVLVVVVILSLLLLPRCCSISRTQCNYRTFYYRNQARMNALHCGGPCHRRNRCPFVLRSADESRYVWISPPERFLQRCLPHV